MTRPVLVTGAGGFIGSRLVCRLREGRRPVRALLLPAEPVPTGWDEDVDIIRGDIADASARSRATDGAGSVFHLAAVVGDWGPEALFRRVTVEGTRGMLEAAARNHSRFVLASSIVVYGHRLGREPCVEALPHGRAFGPYGRSKQAQERLAREWLDRGADVRIVRPANVFGPGSRVWVDEVIRLLRTGAPILIDGGRGNAGLVHVDNVVDILVRAASDRGCPGDVFNACDEFGVSWRRYFSDLAALAKTRLPRSLPSWLAWPLAWTMEPLWRLARSGQRPPLTREALQLVSSDHRVPAERAREVLGHASLLDYGQAIGGLSEYVARSGMSGTGSSG